MIPLRLLWLLQHLRCQKLKKSSPGQKNKVHKNSPGWGWICNSSQSACSRPETKVYFSDNLGFNKYLFDSNWYFFDNFPTHKFLSHPLKSIFLIRLIPKAAMYIFLCSGVFVRNIFSFLDKFSVPTCSNYFENILKIFSVSLPTCSSLPLFPSPPLPSSRCSRYCLWEHLFEELQKWKWDEEIYTCWGQQLQLQTSWMWNSLFTLSWRERALDDLNTSLRSMCPPKYHSEALLL